MSQSVEDIFDQYVDSLLSGNDLPACMQDESDMTAMLAPLLQTSELVTRQLRTVQPSPRFRMAAHTRMRSLFFARLARKESRPGFLSVWWQQRWATAMATAMVLCLAGLGVLAASFNALPSGFFYPVKVTSEQARLALSTSEYERAQLRLEYTERRLTEMTSMADRGDAETAVLLAGEVTRLLVQTATSAVFDVTIVEGSSTMVSADNSAVAPIVVLNADRTESLAILERVLATAPDDMKPEIERLMTELSREFDLTIAHLETMTVS